MIKVTKVEVWNGRDGDVHVQVTAQNFNRQTIIGNAPAMSKEDVGEVVKELIRRLDAEQSHVSLKDLPLPY